MAVSTPYLHDDTEPGVSVRVDIGADTAVSLLTVRGPWDERLRRTTSVSLRRCFTDHPDALIVDLSRLLDPRSESAPTWTVARTVAAELRPPVHLALCVPPDLPLADRMQGLGAGSRFLPVFAKVRQARVAVAGRLPGVERMIAVLRPDTDAPSTARNLVSDACLAWGLAHLLHPSRLVMSELVTNAVEHAGTEIRVVVAWRGTGLHLSVGDGSPRMPHLLRPPRPRQGHPLDERGRGLRAVHETAELWGAVPTPEGKVVWATVRPRRTVA
ncbi:ATP-binding protein [Actinoplanes awajinensis]|uniref:Anti-sigma regulatory factor n=1 Tax=Actinoplanes awajinensis subsp. mycoplanecinus TaxID=135947 RepID=A0A0X3V8P0_9ACTN|nr:ATP-binding protein [Actinoplanes awajinensis]KUL39636.1 anti-sigma regulatory factor [Actinoplanes awajinensis subsp. mycoplanecinus]